MIINNIYAIIICIVAVIFIVIMYFITFYQRRFAPFEPVKSYFDNKANYQFFVRFCDNDKEPHWEQVKSFTNDIIVTDKGQTLSCRKTKAIIVVYPNGEIVATTGKLTSVPPNIRFLTMKKREHILDLARVEEGNRYVHVSYKKSPHSSTEKFHYATMLTNISNEPIRIIKFGPYFNIDQKWTSSVSYDAEQFHSWYGMNSDQYWILPGESVCDYSNYGGMPIIWAYNFETPSQYDLIAGGLLDQTSWLKISVD